MELSPSFPSLSSSIGETLVGKRLHEITHWRDVLPRPEDAALMGKWEEVTEYLGRVMPQI